MRLWLTLLPVAIAATGIAWWLTAPATVDASQIVALDGDATQGEAVFHASGCASCHHAENAENDTVLSGGQGFASGFGTFYAPNISPHPEAGIGDWSVADFAGAVRLGVSPDGAHLYPAFPYAAYGRMTDQDLVDLWAFMQTLPPDETVNRPHEVGFPFNIRAGLGVWKVLYADRGWVLDVPPELERGRYLVEALGHCGECHTPRNALGALDRSAWMQGAPNPSGSGRIPALTPNSLTWSVEDIAYYLETGFTPDYDSVGGHMAEVVENFSKLPAEDRQAVAAYIKALPAP
ncbi:cytochrome c [Citreimonas salinaria]|uniref:Cytochrome c, mono-and diheme variants n=1 Tax=Citreimonas salinaria TaxID=321339 RepID=A0A1H3G813_9RHOB|nr:cytochrome c [Citreimonas salinaria]SDX99177.1 Cytochrome c, mono-and diheme variants [Citreimonas salinaria]